MKPTEHPLPETAQDTLIIDPVKMNIVNRVAAGTSLRGEFNFKGGLLLQGTLHGSGEIAGRVVVWHAGHLVGRFKVRGDLYVLGNVGGVADEVDESTLIECLGMAYVASTGVCTGTIVANSLRMYDGAVMQGPFKTLRGEQALPVLQPR